jgi:glycosyltransferase involved in cell wall biosynthesis
MVPQARSWRDDVEIIVIDNGAADEVANICARFAESVVYLREPRKGSPPTTGLWRMCTT